MQALRAAALLACLCLLGEATAFLPPTLLRPARSGLSLARQGGSSQGSVALEMVMNKRRVAVSSGRGNSGTELGAHITQGLRIKDAVVTCLEPQLRKVANGPIECSLDSIYSKENLDHTDTEFMAWHAASGMRVMSGCPVHVLYGIQGGCEACKCRMPSMSEVKRFCPYYGSAGKDHASRSAWDLKEKLIDVLKESSTLVIISAGEDISAGPNLPAHQVILQAQQELLALAKKAQVGHIVLVGPSDEPPLGASKQTERVRLDFEIVHGLYALPTQFEGMREPIESQDEKSTNSMMGRNIPPLLLEKTLEDEGMQFKIIRAPFEVLNGFDFSDVVVDAIMRPTPETHMWIHPKPKVAPKVYAAKSATAAAVGKSGGGADEVSKASILASERDAIVNNVFGNDS